MDRVSARVLARHGRELDVTEGGGDPLVVAGCAPVLALVGAHARAVGLDVLVVRAGSGRALELVRRGHAHVAGVHVAPSTREHAEVAATHFGAALAVGGVRWEVGVLSTHRVRSFASVGDDPSDGRRLASREHGSGARARLDAWFPARARHAALELGSHEDVARAVRWGAADLGVAIAPIAREHELAFVAVDDEPFDLVLPEALASDVRVSRLLDVLDSAALRDEIARVGGYDVDNLGTVQRAA
jgi:putative molybdopterin biosynthesis protein